jgi:hypothetical protein
MVRSVTTFDPDWTDDDIAAALAWTDADRGNCAGCGLPREETFDPERANAYDAEAIACHACAARDRAARDFNQKNGDTSGVYWRITERG